ncbi:MAG: PIN domain-containing protein [Bacteroidia bacterium]
MKIVVDTNIVFSALLNSTSSIGKILLDPETDFKFYTCNYMPVEIKRHWGKLKSLSSLSDSDLKKLYLYLLKRIELVKENIISVKHLLRAENLVKEFDVDDTDFVALTIHLKGLLWTGDKKLYNGLKKNNFKSVINTNEIKALWLNKKI